MKVGRDIVFSNTAKISSYFRASSDSYFRFVTFKPIAFNLLGAYPLGNNLKVYCRLYYIARNRMLLLQKIIFYHNEYKRNRNIFNIV